jgi:hypothetical protein
MKHFMLAAFFIGCGDKEEDSAASEEATEESTEETEESSEESE